MSTAEEKIAAAEDAMVRAEAKLVEAERNNCDMTYIVALMNRANELRRSWNLVREERLQSLPLSGAIAAAAPAAKYNPGVHVLHLPTVFPDSLGSKHPDGTIHASTIVANSDAGEKEQLKLWFKASLAGDNHFELDKPIPDGREAVASWTFTDYTDDLERLQFKVWDIQNATGETVQIILEDVRGKRRKLSGRADFLITSSDVESRATAQPFARCVVEIQSKRNEDDCEFQLKAFLVIMMNLYGFESLAGILVYDNGTCRAYRARRGESGDALYEENDTFHLCQVADVLPTLLNC